MQKTAPVALWVINKAVTLPSSSKYLGFYDGWRIAQFPPQWAGEVCQALISMHRIRGTKNGIGISLDQTTFRLLIKQSNKLSF